LKPSPVERGLEPTEKGLDSFPSMGSPMALKEVSEKVRLFRIAGDARGLRRVGVSSTPQPRLTLVSAQPDQATKPNNQPNKQRNKPPTDLDKSVPVQNLKRGARAGIPGRPGLKKARKAEQSGGTMPPTPMGCEWRKSDDGWNLWRCWSEQDGTLSHRVRKSRYAGYLSNEAWEVLKGYDYETFLSITGERLRRYGKR